MKTRLAWVAILLAFSLTSCGGDGPGLAGGRNGNGNPDPNDPDPTDPSLSINNLELLASSAQLSSDGSTTATLSAVAKNANNQVVEGVPVTFAASSGTLVVTSATTNAQGVATAELLTGGDPTNRTVEVTATSGTVTGSVNVDIIGSTVQIQGPTSLVNGSSGNYVVLLADAAGAGIPNKEVTVDSENGNGIEAPSLVTDGTGRINFSLSADVPGEDTLTVTALGNSVSATTAVNISSDNFRFTAPDTGEEINIETAATPVTVTWEKAGGVPQENENISFHSTRGTLSALTAMTNAAGEATVNISSLTAGPAIITATNDEGTSAQVAVEFIATAPDQISLQSDPGVIGVNETSTITAIVQDDANNRVKGATVNFTLHDTTGGSLSIGSAITDSHGRAQTVYTATSATSADDGVVVTGTVEGTALQAQTSVTVAGRALFITFGTGNTIIEDDADTTYTKEYSLFVSDASGAGVANTAVNLRVLSTTFIKGHLTFDTVDSEWDQNVNATCPSEDLNANGMLDTTPIFEDVNGDGVLTPGNVAIVSPGTITTDATGRAIFQITYPQNFAFWVEARITASATVAGTESRKSEMFYFPASAADLATGGSPPNEDSPWGDSASCNDDL